jgi:phospholipase/lecithinase/hemolysin
MVSPGVPLALFITSLSFRLHFTEQLLDYPRQTSAAIEGAYRHSRSCGDHDVPRIGDRPMIALRVLKYGIILLVLGLAAAQAQATPFVRFSDIVGFGDSETDSGNAFLASSLLDNTAPNPSPPYFAGRWSNGPNWIDYLSRSRLLAKRYIVGVAPSLERGPNYAWGGARTGDSSRVPSLIDQVRRYLITRDFKADPRALYIIWAGGNDLRDVLNGQVAAVTAVAQAVDNIALAIRRLQRTGAVHIVVFNLPNLGLAPAVNQNPKLVEAATGLTDAFNQALTNALHDLPRVMLFDLYRLAEEAISNPEAFGLVNVTDACIGDPLTEEAMFEVCQEPEGFLFWDSLHLTTAGHRLLASELRSFLLLRH